MNAQRRNKSITLGLSVAIAVLGLWACGGSGQTQNPDQLWRYDGRAGPAGWGRLHPQFYACASGQAQSPIGIERALPQTLPRVRFRYQPTKPTVEYDGRLVRMSVEDAGEVVVARRHFALREILFHSPSEHQVEGKTYPIEVQLVHQGPERTLFVVSVFMDHGDERPVMDWLWPLLPDEKATLQVAPREVDFTTMLPPDRRGFRYSGSLTTPPCDEPVSWLIVQQPISVSPDRIDRFKERFPPSQRPLQPAQNRPVLTDVVPQAALRPTPRRVRVL